MHMRLQARSSWLDLPDENELDWSVLKNRLIIHPSGLRVLAAPAKPQDPLIISAERVTHLLNLLKHHVAFTIVDTPHVYSPAFVQAVTMADMGLHIITPEVVSVQTAVQLNRLLNKQGIQVKRKSHILNQHTPEAQLPQAAVERGLNNKVAFQISYDSNQARAITQGVPLTLTSAKSGLPNVVRRMSEAIWQRVSTKSL